MTLSELYDKIYTDELAKDSDSFIDIFESNKELIDNQTINANQDLHSKVMRLTADYAHNLTVKGNYKKAIPFIDRAIELFQSNKEFENIDLFKIEFYEILVFDRVMSNYYLKNFKDVKQDLKILTDKFPDNNKYKNWLAATKTYSIKKLINILWYVVAAVVILTSFTEREDIGILYDIILYLGAVTLIVAVSAEILKARNNKKIKNFG